MPVYFFDTHDDETFIEDDIGIDLPNLEAAKAEAARSLAELARDVIRVLLGDVWQLTREMNDSRCFVRC